jgi:hypothetical protein
LDDRNNYFVQFSPAVEILVISNAASCFWGSGFAECLRRLSQGQELKVIITSSRHYLFVCTFSR